ncbi:hypothetical protein [Agrococcus sp. DT81.2]|uniref:hypothetical protein n=1 Tax=Agrococcus sp. DT81.2 TaxID=3393414 RepID=UPI003CE4EE60
MNQAEASQLLTIAATLDNRAVTTEAVQVWAGLLDDIDYVDAVAALKAHYRESTKWMMPANVRERVAAAQSEARKAPWKDLAARRQALLDAGIDYLAVEAGDPAAIEAAARLGKAAA